MPEAYSEVHCNPMMIETHSEAHDMFAGQSKTGGACRLPSHWQAVADGNSAHRTILYLMPPNEEELP